MSGVDRVRWMGRNWALAIFAAGPLTFAGCGGDDGAVPIEPAATAPAPPGAPGAPGDAHGASAPMPGGAHGAALPGPGGAHGLGGGHGDASISGNVAAPGEAHAAPPGEPSAAHGGSDMAAAAPTEAHAGAPGPSAAHGVGAAGGPLAGGPGASHGDSSAGSPAMAHGGSSSAGPGGAHGGPLAGGPAQSHGGPGGAHSQPEAATTASGAKPTTEEWLGGLAAGLFGSSAPPAGAPGGEYVPPGEESSAAGGALPGPGAAHGDAAAMEAGAPGEEGYSGAPGAEGASGGGGQPKQFEEGTAEHTVQQFVLKIQAGDTAGVVPLISERTKDPVLAPLRDGSSDAETLGKAKTLTAGANLVNVRTGPGTKSFIIQNSAGQTLTITAKREAGSYKVSEVKVAAPPRGRR